jgi:hypothetical protein
MNAQWLKDTAERALATSAQVLLVYLGADALNVLAVDWKAAGGIAAGGAVLSVLKSLAARRTGDPDSASLVK